MALRLVKTAMTLLAIALPFLPMSTAFGQEAQQAFGFRTAEVTGHLIGGVPQGAVSLAGGGAYDPASPIIHAGGSFKCTQTVTNPGAALYGCQAGQGGDWHALTMIPSREFRCFGNPGARPTAVTDDNTVVMGAHFYVQGEDEPRLVEMFVSRDDEYPSPDDQKVWVQGVGCGDAIANFN